LLWLGAGLTLLATVAALALLWWLVGAAQGHFDLRFNAGPLLWPDWRAWLHGPDLQAALGVVAAVAAALLMLLAVPALFVLALLCGALFSALGLAGLLLVVALLGALALSPLWLILVVLWWMWRRQNTARAPVSP
jgi:hypothetical protein